MIGAPCCRPLSVEEGLSPPQCPRAGQAPPVWVTRQEEELDLRQKRTEQALGVPDSPRETVSVTIVLWIPRGPFRNKATGFD